MKEVTVTFVGTDFVPSSDPIAAEDWQQQWKWKCDQAVMHLAFITQNISADIHSLEAVECLAAAVLN